MAQYVVQYCKRNIDPDVRTLLSNTDHDVREQLCLQRCGECYDTSFLVVNGQKIEFDEVTPRDDLPQSVLETGDLE